MTSDINRQRSTVGSGSAVSPSSGQSTLDQVRDKTSEIASDIQDSAQQTYDQVARNLPSQVSDSPWLVIGAGVAVGYLLGNMIGGQRQQVSWNTQQPDMHYASQSYSHYNQGQAMEQATQYEANQREGTFGKLGRKYFSSLNSLEDLFQEQLQDLYDAEHQILKALPMMIQHTTAPELKRAFEAHLQQTRHQVHRLEQIFQQLGVPARGKSCQAMQGLLAEGQELMSMRADPHVMDAGLIASAQRVEHYEIAGYGCLRTWARQLGYNQALSLLEQTINEEGQTDKRLSEIAENLVNPKAA